MYPGDVRYTREHEWVRLEGHTAVIGITSYAQDELGDVVYVELPAVGEMVSLGGEFGTVESVKAVSPLFAPLAGEIMEVNEALIGQPELVNAEPYGSGWMIKVTVSSRDELDGLLDAEAYEQFVNDLHA
jgi:glycine cleavage system H protein